VGRDDRSTTRRRDLARAVFDHAVTRQHVDAVDPALESYTLHVGGRHVELVHGDLQRIVTAWHDAFSDFGFDVHAVVVDGDIAAVHATLHGTHVGEWNGRPPTGESHIAEHMCFIRFGGDRIREVWELYDPATLP
jgi:predicted ester cyclase